jgi:hypothetical protein
MTRLVRRLPRNRDLDRILHISGPLTLTGVVPDFEKTIQT